MRRIFGIVVAILILSLAACGSQDHDSTVSQEIVETTTTSTSTTTSPIEPATSASTISSTTSTTTTQPSSTVAEVAEEIAFTSSLGSCDFASQPIPDPATPVGTITIESIGLNVSLISGLRKEMEVPAMCVGSAQLGTPGISVIGGHRTTYGGYFRYLPEVKDGDVIVITLADGTGLEYKVWGNPELYLATDAARVIQGGSNKNVLKIFTCGPQPGDSTHRWVVTAVLNG